MNSFSGSGQTMIDAFAADIMDVNYLMLQLIREIARADYLMAVQQFDLGTAKTAQRIARFTPGDLRALANTREPLFAVRDSKAFQALMAQIEGRAGEERIELTRLAAMLAGAPTPTRDIGSEG
jgi:hypothetical protein